MKKIMILAALAALALTACAKFETEKPVVDERIDAVFLRNKLCTKTFSCSACAYECEYCDFSDFF